MKTITINVKDSVLDNVLNLLKNLTDIEIVQTKKTDEQDNDEKWAYWRDDELDNFETFGV